MNLQGRTASGLLIVAALMLFGCESPSEIGLELNPNENNVGVYEEEFVLPSSVIFYDSVNTTSDPRLLVGKFNDPFFGEITTKSFAQITRDGEVGAISDQGVLDSITFSFELNYIYGEFGGFFQTINVFQLADTLYSGVNYFADDSTNYAFRTPVAVKKFVYSPSVDTVIRIKADPTWANTFFTTVRDGVTTEELRNEIKGFALIPGSENTFVFGFSPENSKLNVHYHLPDGTDSLTFTMNFNGPVRYNGIVADRSGTELEALSQSGDELNPASGKVYLQGGTGIYTKLSLEPYRKFADSIGNMIVNKAQIILGPNDELSSTEYRILPPSSLRYIFADSTNKIVGANILLPSRIFNNVIMNDQAYLTQNSALSLSPRYDSASRSYRETPTLFFQYLRDSIYNVDEIIVFPGSNDVNSLNRFIVPKDNIRLKIYYTRLN